LHDALEAARLEHRTQAQRYEETKAQLQAVYECFEAGRSQREVLRESAVARLQARLESWPVIEQAKGIIMAEQRCGPQEALDLLRRECQRAHVEVRVLAAQIVEQVASPAAAASARPVRPAASKHA
jgi:AmiR/NasT family two-component response regulator